MVNGEKREMEVVYDTIESDEREEGEIVDDELEDVSDSTIHSPTHAGKSVATSDHLRAVSLSSISEDEVELTRRVKQKRFLTREERRCRYLPLQVECCHRRPEKRKRRRHHSRADSSSDSDVPDRSMVRLLKNAVHISKDAENCQNSLQTRLKALIAGSSGKSQSEDEAETNELRKAALESKKEPEAPLNVTEDKELEELRLEALKSAIIQKHEQRKKKKGENVDKDEVNKENQQNNVMKEKTEQKTVSEPVTTENLVNSVNQSVEEDLDIMRAMLLASISTKISKIPTPDLPKAPSQVNAKIVVRKPVNVVRTVKNDYYNKNRLVFNPKKTINNRTQPIKLPNVAPLIIQVNNDSDSDMDLGTLPEEDPMAKKVEELLKQQRAEIEAKTEQKTVKQKPVEQKPVINNVKPPPKPSLDKSIVKLLPLSQQIEYQKLTQLINSKRRPRARRFSQRNNDKEVGVTKRAFKTKFALSKLNGSHNKVVKPKVEKNAPIALKRTLDDLQVHKDGRLQMKGKYQELEPLLKKINEVSVVRKRYENELKKLLEDLGKTKAKLNTSHQSFKYLVQELVKKKEMIDKGAKPVTSTPVKSVVVPFKAPETPVETVSNILDPNDLNSDDIVRNLDSNDASKVPQYISPLDYRSSSVSDPLVALCPFDLLGVCKDKECNFRHCS